MWTKADLEFMQQTLSLAKSAEGRSAPDPMVGAILVKDGRIVAMGYHGEVTTPHAEAWAIQKAGRDAKGSTLYINLEPCCHYGNNPPCTDLIIKSGIKEVVASMVDPNPVVKGKGFASLIKNGIRVRIGLMETEAKQLNEAFIKFITTKRPFIVMKTAITLDGKIATKTGASRWVSSKETRKYSHHLRNVYDAILVGVSTVLVDNPKLTVRAVKKIKNPIRIILDTYAKTPIRADVLSREARTVIVVGEKAPKPRIEALEEAGAEIIKIPAKNGKIDVKKLVKRLGAMRITSLLLEGGGEINASFVEAGLVDKALFIIAPKIFGGRNAKTCVEGEGIKLPAQAKELCDLQIARIGPDIFISGYF